MVKGMHNISLKRQIIFPLAIAYIVLTLLLFTIAGKTFSLNRDKTIHATTLEVDHYYREAIDLRIQKLGTGLAFLSHNSEILKAWSNLDSITLAEYSATLFSSLRQDFNIDYFYFHTPKGDNLLRLHNMQKSGNQVRRETLLRSMSTRSRISGVELGEEGTITLRSIQPIYYQNRLIGYAELGEGVEDVFKNIKDNFNVEAVALINKKYLNASSWIGHRAQKNRPNSWNQLQSHVVSLSTFSDEPSALISV